MKRLFGLSLILLSLVGCTHESKRNDGGAQKGQEYFETQGQKYLALINQSSFDTAHLSCHIRFDLEESYGRELISYDIRTSDTLSLIELKIKTFNFSNFLSVQDSARTFSKPTIRSCGQFARTKEILFYKEFLDLQVSQLRKEQITGMIDDRPTSVSYYDGHRQYFFSGKTINYSNMDKVNSFFESSTLYKKLKAEMVAAFNDRTVI